MMSTTVRVSILALATLLSGAIGVARAQERTAPPDGPRIVDTKLDEAERIERRREWFLSTRRAGVSSDEEMARLRATAVAATREAIRAQRARRFAGIESEQNFWISKGPSPSTFGGWTFGNVSGRVSALAADRASGTLWVGTASGGVWKSVNDGLSWTAVFDAAGTMTVGTVTVDPNDPNVVWVGTGENNQGCESYFGIGLLRSGDGGATWEPRNGTSGQTLDDLSSFADIVVDPRDSSRIVTGGRIRGCTGGSSTSGGIFTSDDAGATWTERLAGVSVYEIRQDPIVLDTFWAATAAGVYKSTDNALTWTLQTASGLPNGSTGRTELAVSPSDSNVVYVLFQSPNQLWRTTDGGATWSLRASGSDACDGQCSYNMVLRVHNENPDIVVRGTIRIWRSTDGGVTWTDLSNGWGSSQKVHQDMHVLVMDPDDPNAFYAGGDGGLWKTVNLGDSFTNKNGNLNITQFYAVGVEADDPETICGGAQDNSSLARTTSDVWDLQTVTGDGFVCHFDPIDPSYAYITSYPSGGYPSVYRSTGGVFGGFSRITGSGSGIQNGDRSNWVTPYLLDPRHPETLYLGTHRAYRSDDHGTSWTQVGPADLTGGSGSLVALEIHRIHTEVLYSGSQSGRVFRTTDGGTTWVDITTGLPGRSVNDVAADPDDRDRALAVVGGFNSAHLWEWTASTGAWVERGAGLPNVPANTVLMLSSSDVLVGTDTGVFRSTDGGATFEPYMNGLPEGLVVTDLKYNPTQSIVTAGTYGRGAWQVTVQSYGSILVYDSVELPLTEVDGDGDANVEPGETWSVRPVLRNIGSAVAGQVSARVVSATPGVTVLDPAPRAFGDVGPGTTAVPQEPVEFTVDPGISCGNVAVFDVVDIASADPSTHEDEVAAFDVAIDDGVPPPVYTTLLEETFEGAVGPEWTHQVVDPNLPGCNKSSRDEWNLASKDAAHGTSYHCGNGPGGSYGTLNHAWLHYGGLDSAGGPGLSIPATAEVATLTIEHWYETVVNGDGGQVAIDAVADGQDVFSPLVPEGGYSPGDIAGAGCNGLEGMQAFHGSSGGWITSTFDLSVYRGKTVWLAFVFGSDDRRQNDGEGWYVDNVRVEIQEPGAPTCDVTRWPGSTTGVLRIERGAGTDLVASWGASCNEGEVPGQTYALHAGSLAALRGGVYDHAPVGDRCDRTSPATFAAGAGDEYYLVAPVGGGREGGTGFDSSGASRPQASPVCGLPRAETCP